MIILETMALEAIILEITTIIMKIKEVTTALEMKIKGVTITQNLKETTEVSEAMVVTWIITQEVMEAKETNQETTEAVLEVEALQETKVML